MPNNLPRLLITGAALSAVLLMASLFTYFQPAVSNNIWQDAKAVSASFFQICQDMLGKVVSRQEEDQQAEWASMKAESTAAGLEVSVPTAGRPRGTGDIADLEMAYSQGPSPDNTYSIMLDTALGPMLYYNQGDSRWRDYLYGGKDPMKKYGCGPTAVAMIINSFSNTPEGAAGITPPQMADWAVEHGLYAPQSGSYHSIIPEALTAYGLQIESVTDRSRDHASELLSSGHMLVALMGKGALTDNGHFVLITGILENGNVTIADPNKYENCTKEWDLEQILHELKKVYDNGGPLWAVSSPMGS